MSLYRKTVFILLIILLYPLSLSAEAPVSLKEQTSGDTVLLNDIQSLENQINILSENNRKLFEELDSLKENMNKPKFLQYQGNTDSNNIPLTGDVASDFEIRISDLQERIQNLNGKYEEADYALRQLQQNVERLTSDIDFRITQLEQETKALQERTILNQSQTQASADSVAKPKIIIAEPKQESEKEILNREIAQASTIDTKPITAAQTQYDKAFSLLRESKYLEAEQEFQEFIKLYPQNDLISNAKYWLGESYYARGQYKDALLTFADGYQNYPTHNKAQDHMLKMGLSLAALNQKDDACTTFSQFMIKYEKTASKQILKRIQDQQVKLGCKK